MLTQCEYLFTSPYGGAGKIKLLQITAFLTEVQLEEIMYVANFVFEYLPDKAN